MADPEEFPLVPEPEPGLSPEDDVAAAELSFLDADGETITVVREPLGRTALFDFGARRFVRAGGAPVYVTGVEALAQRCQMVVHTSRFRHPIFDGTFGMLNREGPIGEVVNLGDAISDWTEDLVESLTALEDVVAVEDVQVVWDETIRAVVLVAATVIHEGASDEQEPLSLGPIVATEGV